ncbi:tektin-2-like [Haliotis rufescens]|uniref:tektin-2-like n=1 Tax=Haliotis rufescens TaxID=6454 RepID=UPI001EAFC64C|nr:tektin-2-like [Haliotis rufescens]XP_046332599.1 tektin-2-like [Haliotis rufescens]
MATQLRPTTRYQPPDWFTSNYTISTNAERQRDASHQVRQEGRFLRNETDNQTKWDQHSNNVRLADRVDNIRKWKEILEKTLADTDREIADLTESKEQTEQALEAKNLPLDVAIECLTLREGRQAIDVVQDEPEAQLHKEVEVIEGIKKQLQQRVDESFEQLCLLQEARQQLQADLQDKNIALGIDIDQYNLTDRSPNISYKPDSLRVPKGSTTPQQWEDFSRYNKERAEAEMKASTRLREAIHHTLQQTANDLEAQRIASEYAFRKRIHEFERAKDELEWQKKNTEEEIADMENDIRGLEESIRAKINPMKLAQTRLENRTYRPNVELCRDAPQYGLTDEVKQLEATKRALEEKCNQAKHALDGLEKNLHRINDDLALKNNSLMLDNRCMNVRQKLQARPQSTIERNLTLTGMERQRSTVLA